VRRGEIATVLGSNGAGKTTILKTISGIIDPRKGSVEFKGEDITAPGPGATSCRQGLSHVPEGREVFPLLSVHDNLLMGAYTRSDRDGVARDLETVFGYFPILQERAAAGCRPAVGRAAADAGDQPRADGQPRPDPAGRAQPGPVARSSPRRSSRSWCASTASAAPPSCWWSKTPTWRSTPADYGYVLENGRIVMEDTCADLREKDDIKEFYLGLKDDGVRGERRWKKKKTGDERYGRT